jgi:hypothetical protein
MVSWQQVIITLAAGVSWAVLGYLRAIKDGETFSSPKFIKSILLGCVVGAAMTYQGTLNPDTTWSWLSNLGVLTGLTALLDKIVTAVFAKSAVRQEP